MDFYYLDENKNPILVADPYANTSLITIWMGIEHRRVAYSELDNGKSVSTVFLNYDHNYSQDGDPILFETMVFGDDSDEEYQTRYNTYEQAEIGHEIAIAFAEGRLMHVCSREFP